MTTSLVARTSRFSLVLLVVGLAASGCREKGSDGATDGGTGKTANAPPSGKHAAVPADVCALLKPSDVATLLGEKVEAKQVPGGGCQFAGGTAKSLYPTVSIAEDFAGAGGIEGAKTGAQASTGGTASPLTVSGAAGYAVTGKLAGSTMTQAAVASRGLLVTVTMSGGEKANNEKVAAKLLEMTLAKL